MSDERKLAIPGFVGGYLYEAGLITLEQLDAALDRQLELTVNGRPLRLGEVLVEMGAITPEQLAQALNQQIVDKAKIRRAPGGRPLKPLFD